MIYNYWVVHIKGAKNCNADCLSRLLMWMANKDRDYKTTTITRCLVSHRTTNRDVARLIKHSPDSPSNENPMIDKWSTKAGEDEAYMRALKAIKNGKACKTLPKEDEAYKMGGEW